MDWAAARTSARARSAIRTVPVSSSGANSSRRLRSLSWSAAIALLWRAVSPFWIYTQVAIVIFVLAGIVIGAIKLLT